jgi:hypothetical protein
VRTFLDVLSASGLPGYKRARLAGEIPLGKNMVGEVCQTLALEVRHIEANALGRSVGARTVHIFVVHPDGYGNILCIL